MSRVLVKTHYSVGDLDLSSFSVMSEKKMDKAVKRVNKYFDKGGEPIVVQVHNGTYIQFDTAEEFFSNVVINYLDEEDLIVITTQVDYNFGPLPFLKVYETFKSYRKDDNNYNCLPVYDIEEVKDDE